MGLFRTKEEKRLDAIIMKLEMNMSNNYKDNAQSDLRDLEETLHRMKENGQIKDKVFEAYDSLVGQYKVKMQGYSHKDQKPYWT